MLLNMGILIVFSEKRRRSRGGEKNDWGLGRKGVRLYTAQAIKRR
jgi:hypothetical protein